MHFFFFGPRKKIDESEIENDASFWLRFPKIIIQNTELAEPYCVNYFQYLD